MNQINKDKKVGVNWKIGEFVLGLIALAYFLIYPRDTLSDFVVLSNLCLLLTLSQTKIGLTKPAIYPNSRADTLMVIITGGLFLFAWIYGMVEGKLNSETVIKSLLITIVYFYYAFIQHFLAQRYLSLRLFLAIEDNGLILKYGLCRRQIAALLTGFIFGIMHIPYPDLILPSMIGGFLYSYYFLITGRLWVIVISHALVSSTLIFWYLGENPFLELI